MNGTGLLIVILFSTIIWWGTSSYYKRRIEIMRDAHFKTLMNYVLERDEGER